MPELDASSRVQIESGTFAAAFFIWLDIDGDPIRITTSGQNIVFSGTGDPDLDGRTFIAFDHRVIQVGDVSNSESGSDTLTIQLSGIPSIDGAFMAEIADTAKWRGRTVRLWMQVYDETGQTPRGAIIPYYTGYASAVRVIPSPKVQVVQLEVENYLAAFNEPSNRSYLNQSDYDPTDISAAATLAAANMGRGTPTTGGTGGSLSGGAGGGGVDSGGYQLPLPGRYQ